MEVDVKNLDVDQMVLVRDLPIPEGTRLVRQVSISAPPYNVELSPLLYSMRLSSSLKLCAACVCLTQDFDAPVIKCTTESGDEIRVQGSST